MLDAMTKSSDSNVRDMAISNIAAAERARAVRATLAEVRPTMNLLTGAGSTKKQRVIHNAKRKPNLNGPVIRREGGGAVKGDHETNEAYRFAGYVHDFYRKILKRNSIDDLGMPLKSSVRYREDPSVPYNNAFWWQQQMGYGEGDGTVFKRFTGSLDVVGHEHSHGLVEYTANLVYRGEPGALNESFADVFGILVKQWKNKEKASQSDWLIGQELIFQSPTRRALRSMKAPGTAYQNDPDLLSDPQPAHMDQKYLGAADSYGVHINSGIPNHAFYHVAIDIGGNAWEKPCAIWYDALHRLRANSDFDDCAKATYLSAGSLFGIGSNEQKAVKKGWNKVGIAV